VCQTFFYTRSFPGILLKHREHQRDTGKANVFPGLLFKNNLLRKNFVENYFVLAALKGWVATQKDIHDHSERPNVTPLIIVSLENLGCNVVRGANNRMHVLFFPRKLLTQAEVY